MQNLKLDIAFLQHLYSEKLAIVNKLKVFCLDCFNCKFNPKSVVDELNKLTFSEFKKIFKLFPQILIDETVKPMVI